MVYTIYTTSFYVSYVREFGPPRDHRRHRRRRHRAIFGANRDDNPSRKLRDGARTPRP